jgi:rubrerythrin
MAKELKETKTHENLKAAFSGESQANRRYLYFAKVADVEGYPEIASNFRETAEGETGHAHGHLDYIKQVGDPATGLPIGDTAENLADRRHRREPEGGGGGRDPRVHRHVPRHGEDGP